MIEYRDATRDDGQRLAAVARATFMETFGGLYRLADLEAFLADWSDDAYAAELADGDHEVRFAHINGGPIGFCKIARQHLPFDSGGRRALELRQLYVFRPWHGTAVARTLMEWALARCRARGAQEVWLSVFSENMRGRAFYRRYGFTEIAPYTFMVGSHADDDILCRLTLDG